MTQDLPVKNYCSLLHLDFGAYLILLLCEGGTFALYSLLRQHVNFKGNMPVPVTQLESDVNLKYHSKKSKLPSKMLEFLERSTAAQVIITGIVLCATSMVMGDGALTPAISGTFSGICIFCTDLMNGIPPIVRHYVQHVVSVREVMVFVTVRILPVRSVLPEERFLVDKLDHVGVYRCILQYGYMDNHNIDDDNFVVLVVASLKKIAENDHEIALLDSAFTNETTFVLGRTILKMSAKHNCFKRFVVNELYRFLQKNFRSNMSSLKIAHGKALQVGMLYEI